VWLLQLTTFSKFYKCRAVVCDVRASCCLSCKSLWYFTCTLVWCDSDNVSVWDLSTRKDCIVYLSYLHSFFLSERVVNIWNSLPVDVSISRHITSNSSPENLILHSLCRDQSNLWLTFSCSTWPHNVYITNCALRDVSHGLSIDYVQSELHKRTFINRINSNCY